MNSETNPPINELAAALARAQGKIENAKKKNANPFFKSKYADLGTVWDAIREPLSEEGLSIVQFLVDTKEGHVGLATMILHSSGQMISAQFSMPVKDSSNPQAVGSAATYARRYALMAAVGIAPEDDDGNAAKGTQAPARALPAAAPAVSWDEEVVKARAGLSMASSDPERRLIFSNVRNSQMPEPMKTTILSEMAETIKAKAFKDTFRSGKAK